MEHLFPNFSMFVLRGIGLFFSGCWTSFDSVSRGALARPKISNLPDGEKAVRQIIHSV